MDLDASNNLSDSAFSLQNRSFKGKDLYGVDFSGADLRGCDFTGANLTGANFAGALTGQSDRQKRVAIALAVAGPAILVGVSFGLSLIISPWLATIPDALWKGLGGWIVVLSWLFKIYFRDRLAKYHPHICDAMGIIAISVLLTATSLILILLIGMLLDSLRSPLGLITIVVVTINVIAGFLVKKVWHWLLEAVQASFGTSFRQANLTNTNWHCSRIGNTNFSGADLTGICVVGWSVRSPQNIMPTLLQATCAYVYVDDDCQQRHPPTGSMQPQDWKDLLK